MLKTILRMSELYAPTLKEDPADADIASARLLLRAGFIRKTASGVYTYLPLGKRVLDKIERIVRIQMDSLGAQEIFMPALQPGDLWHESGRWNDYGPELMRFTDRHDHEFCLGPTHEELVTALVRNELRSYKQLPTTLYQIQSKFRDEIRPRFGLLRSREFVMKDAYSFNADVESLKETYDAMMEAYGRICTMCGLDWRAVEADAGQIGGNETCEFMALADSGESELVTCECGYASDVEVAAASPKPTLYPADGLKKIETPNVATIEELARFLDCPESSTVKAMAGVDAKGEPIVLFIPGDYELNLTKAARLCGGFELMDDQMIEKAGLPKGSIGCVGLPEGVRIGADASLKDIADWVVGANEHGFHYVGAKQGRDFEVDLWGDLCTAKAGDPCPTCGKPLSGCRGIEVSQVFKLGTKYSEAMGATFSDADGREVPFQMGCYGVGVSRTLAAIVEQHNDENGIIWPSSVAPAHVCILPMVVGDDTVQPAAERIADDLASIGIEVVIDDRKERPGVKFAEADLMGWPIQVIVGKRGLENGTYEVKNRVLGIRRDISIDEYKDALAFAKRSMQPMRTWMEHAAAADFSRYRGLL